MYLRVRQTITWGLPGVDRNTRKCSCSYLTIHSTDL
jgi:hypothetical protein